MAVRKYEFEQGPIRPPSEAASLLLRITRNCPWNRCLFCPVYKGKQYSRRKLDEVLADLEAIGAGVDAIKELSLLAGYGGQINNQVAAIVHAQKPHLFQLALWQLHGGTNVFLQDGDSLTLPPGELLEILGRLKEKFPQILRITTYARSRTLLRRSVEELKSMAEAGLTRIHVGLESGSDKVLDFMKKGVTGRQHVEAGLRVKEAGISLSEYVLLGLGGADLWREHALQTAAVLNQINPDFIRFRTLAVRPGSPLAEMLSAGQFTPLTDDEVARELLLLVESLQGIDSQVYSDHILNLLEEVSGALPGDREAIAALIRGYLKLEQKEREIFRLGRRTGHMRVPGDLEDAGARGEMERLRSQILSRGKSVDQFIKELLLQYI